MKKIFEFELEKEEEVDQVTENGDEKIIKKVRKRVPKKFFIRRPNRSLYDSAELFYNSKVAEALSNNNMSVAMLLRKYDDYGGVYSKKQKADFDKAAKEYQADIRRAEELGAKKKLSKEEKAELEKIEKRKESSVEMLLSSHQYEQSILSNSAEYWARERLATWWITKLSYQSEEEPIFSILDYEKALEEYDEILESDDDFKKFVLRVFVSLVALWVVNPSSSEDEFKEALRSLIHEEGRNKRTVS